MADDKTEKEINQVLNNEEEVFEELLSVIAEVSLELPEKEKLKLIDITNEYEILRKILLSYKQDVFL